MILILTGPVQAGKTSFLERALPVWRERGLDCAGFLSPAVIDGSGDRGYDLLEIGTGRRSAFLRRQGEPAGETIGPYAFIPAALERAQAIIRNAGRSSLLIVDEVGPREIGGGGLWPALREVLRDPGRTVLLVVREEILRDLAALIAPLEPAVFDVRDGDDRKLLDQRLVARVGSHGRQS